jgi:ABC-type multidrug transport system fused ATPase/permease subunit
MIRSATGEELRTSTDADLDLTRSIRAIWPLMSDQKRLLAAMVSLGLAASIAESLGFSLIIMLIYLLVSGGQGPFAHGGSQGLIGRWTNTLSGNPVLTGAIIVGLVFAKGVLSTAFTLLAAKLGAIATDRARTSIFRQYLRLPYARVMEEDHAELIHRVTYESDVIARTIGRLAGVAINVGAIIIFGLYITYISSALGASVIVLGISLFGGLALWARSLSEAGARLNQVNERLFQQLLSVIVALRAIRISGRESVFADAFAGASSKIAQTSFRLSIAEDAGRPVRDLGMLMTMGTFLWIAQHFHVQLTATITVVALLYRLLPHVVSIEDQVRAILTEAEPLRSAIRVITSPSPSTAGIEQQSFAGLKDRLEFRDVSFRYRGAEYRSLNNISFWITPGSLVAIAGPSGCGKTTLVNLLARLYEPESGVILVDGVSIKHIDRASWFAQLAFAGQDVELIDGDIVTNVQFGRSDLGREAVLEALAIVEADEFLPRLPHGIDSVIGDRGMSLSGGQRQRIGLARAVIGKPDILVLDEATNAIDLEMEARILNRLRQALPHSTLIVITHRENISQADVWIRMEWGEVADWTDVETESASTRP